MLQQDTFLKVASITGSGTTGSWSTYHLLKYQAGTSWQAVKTSSIYSGSW